ncbi:MAG: DegT/DnrJ/EryC1/StrS family aminotransferase, partial [Clostridiales bacterium]|nr:DegT/DnrJ/EryC1/StrS family aminotransferase [Clostridiales bacterium]
MDRFIPLSIPNFEGNEKKYVDDALEQGWVSTGGAYITRLEQELAQFLRVDNVAACQSGTSALHMSLAEAGVGPGDVVLVPPLTFIAAVNPVKYLFATPVFIDCDDSLCMDPVKLRRFCEEECDIADDAADVVTDDTADDMANGTVGDMADGTNGSEESDRTDGSQEADGTDEPEESDGTDGIEEPGRIDETERKPRLLFRGKPVKAVIVVHVFGNLADMESIMETVGKYGLAVIEDATEALGSKYTSGLYAGKYAGTVGDFGAYSFNGNKIITTGGGGAVTARDAKTVDHMRYLSTQAKDDPHYYI